MRRSLPLLALLALGLSLPAGAAERQARRDACEAASPAESHALACWRLGRARPPAAAPRERPPALREADRSDTRQRRARRDWERARSRHEAGQAVDP